MNTSGKTILRHLWSDIHWAYFMIPFVVIVVIALLTVSFQSVKAALANPVRSLRTE